MRDPIKCNYILEFHINVIKNMLYNKRIFYDCYYGYIYFVIKELMNIKFKSYYINK